MVVRADFDQKFETVSSSRPCLCMKSNVFVVFGAKKEVVDQKNFSETVRELAPHSGELAPQILHRHLFIFFGPGLAPILRYLAPQNRKLAPKNVELNFLKNDKC